MLLEDLLNEYLFHIQTMNYSPRTIKGYKNNNKAFMKYIENEFDLTELDEVKSLHIKKYGLFLIGKGRKETYINGIYKNIRSFFAYSVEEGYLLQKQNPCLNVKWLKEEMPIIEAFTPKEVRDMIDKFKMNTYMEARNKLIIMLFADTGLRNLELCHLMRSDIGETTIQIRGKPLTVEATLRVVKIAGDRANITRDIRISPHTI